MVITSLQHIALSIPEMKVGLDFYQDFGLEAVDRASHVAMRCDGRDQDQLVLLEAGQKRKLHHFSMGTNTEGLDLLISKLQALGIPRCDPPYDGAPEGIWFRDPEDNLVNVQIAEAAPFKSDKALPLINRPGLNTRLGAARFQSLDMRPRPRRLGHFILFARDVVALAKFYMDVLGLRISDWAAGGVGAFLRTCGDSDHHVLGILKSEGSGFHHASFEMGDIDEAEIAAVHFLGKGHRHAWGPGRHGVGSNYFHYFRDPWNGMTEYFCDIDFIPESFPWEAREWGMKDGIFVWSADGLPPPDFGRNYELD